MTTEVKNYAQFIGALTPNLTDQVLEIIQSPIHFEGYVITLEMLYVPLYIQTLVECPEGLQQNAWYDRSGDKHWTNPDGSLCAGVGQPWTNLPPPPEPDPDPVQP